RGLFTAISISFCGGIVRRLSGQTLADFTRGEIFTPLGMEDTMFQPPAGLRDRIAPTAAQTSWTRQFSSGRGAGQAACPFEKLLRWINRRNLSDMLRGGRAVPLKNRNGISVPYLGT